MTKYFVIITAALLWLMVNLSAEECRSVPEIIKSIEEEHINTLSFREMVDFEYHRYHLYDKALNTVYLRLKEKIKGKKRDALISAQKMWIKFRDAEFKLFDQLYSIDCIDFRLMKVGNNIKVVRKRLEELGEFESLLDDHFSEGE